MRHFISSLFFIFIFNNHCSAQNEKIKLSSILSSILLSQNCSLKNEDEKLYFFIYKDKNIQEIINFDSYSSHGAEIVYKTNKKKVVKKLKKVEFGYDASIKVISQDKNEVVLNVDLPKINYDLYTKGIKTKIQIVLEDSWWDMHYAQSNGKWVLTKMICNGF